MGWANIAAWLVSLAWPLVKKVLLALGIGFVTYEGVTMVANQGRDMVVQHWGQLGSASIQIMSLAGVNESIGIVLSAITARAAMLALGKLGKVA